MSGTWRVVWQRALPALVLLVLCAATAAGLWTGGCGPTALQDQASAGPTAYSPAASHDAPGPSCEIRALPASAAVALASVVEVVPVPPAVTLGAPATAVALGSARDTVPASRAVAPLQHPPNVG
ncbi:MAG TPA: hypothetical protein VFE37_01275 [Chloroflexota bacterium]|nr:hypothetical protein [Chloroflexota bacterium]